MKSSPLRVCLSAWVFRPHELQYAPSFSVPVSQQYHLLFGQSTIGKGSPELTAGPNLALRRISFGPWSLEGKFSGSFKWDVLQLYRVPTTPDFATPPCFCTPSLCAHLSLKPLIKANTSRGTGISPRLQGKFSNRAGSRSPPTLLLFPTCTSLHRHKLI